MSIYGCELWTLSNDMISYPCISRRKSLFRVWGLRYDGQIGHFYIIPLLSQCLPLFDEICGHSLSFIKLSVLHESKLVSNISNFHYGRHYSFIGHNALFWAQGYDIALLYRCVRLNNKFITKILYICGTNG
jgi:hypothetical protein